MEPVHAKFSEISAERKSEENPLSCGVPQGSILSPLLFILYINDLSDYLLDSSVSLYADDTALYTTAESQVEIMLNFRVELSIVSEWLKANRLSLNADKTKYMVFGSKNLLTTKPDLNLTVGDKSIERVSSTKYLGVILAEHLSFDEHVSFVHKKASKKLGISYKSKDYLDRSTKILLYKSLIVPHIDYCDLVYMNTTEKN